MIPECSCNSVSVIQVRSLPGTVDDQSLASDGADSDRFSGSVSSFLANEKLMSVDSMNSDVTGEAPPLS